MEGQLMGPWSAFLVGGLIGAQLHSSFSKKILRNDVLRGKGVPYAAALQWLYIAGFFIAFAYGFYETGDSRRIWLSFAVSAMAVDMLLTSLSNRKVGKGLVQAIWDASFDLRHLMCRISKKGRHQLILDRVQTHSRRQGVVECRFEGNIWRMCETDLYLEYEEDALRSMSVPLAQAAEDQLKALKELNFILREAMLPKGVKNQTSPRKRALIHERLKA